MGWNKYYEQISNKKLRLFYLDAVKLMSGKENLTSIDFGCGIGVEVEDMVRRGWEVHAYDSSEESIKLTRLRILEDANQKLHLYHLPFEKIIDLPDVDFFHSFHALPFCQPEFFLSVVRKTIASVRPSGIYAATFFGPEDQWCLQKTASSIEKEELKQMFKVFDLLHFKEIKHLGATALEGEKMWHVIEVIAQRRT